MILDKKDYKSLVNTLSRNEINNVTIETTKNVREEQDKGRSNEEKLFI